MKSKIIVLLSSFFILFAIALINSCSSDDPQPIPKPTASFTASKTTANTGEEITFTNTSTEATSYEWSFGDGTTSTQESPAKTYAAAGTYQVSLTATGPGGADQATQDVTIEEVDPGDEIYFIDYSDGLIQKFAINDPDNMTTFLDVTGFAGVGLAYDEASEMIFFSDFEVLEEGKIWRVNLDGTGVDDIATGLYEPYGIAVGGNKIYYTDEADLDDISHIYRSNLDGSSAEPVITMAGAQFRAVALDPANNKMYFYEVYNEDLYVANMDGTSQSVLIPGVYGYAIQIDTENDKIYFDDQNSGTDGELKMSDLNGANITTVDATASRIYGIAIDNETNKLYWSARDNGEIYQSDLDGSNKITVKGGLASPRGLFLKK